MDKTLRLLALIALDGKKQKEQIQLLDKAGFGQSDIADMLGSTPKAISVRLAELRRARRNYRNI
jgi:DNA-directed RNA polymerase specialized sigma24 family protein